MGGPPAPQRVAKDVDGARAFLVETTDLLETTMARASTFTEDQRHQRVDDEWSTVESLRHIVFVVDVWLGRIIKGEDDPFHPMGLPPHFAPRKPPGSSIAPDAAPTFEEACEAVRGRLEILSAFVNALAPDELARPIEGHAKTVAGGLAVIFDELQAHNYFMNRDLDVIQS